MVVRAGEYSPGYPEQARAPHLEALGLVRSELCGEEARPPGDLLPGLLSRFRHHPFLVLPVTRFIRLTQGFAVLAELQEAVSQLAPHCISCSNPRGLYHIQARTPFPQLGGC